MNRRAFLRAIGSLLAMVGLRKTVEPNPLPDISQVIEEVVDREGWAKYTIRYLVPSEYDEAREAT